jgi:hypothetical protein
MSTSDVHHDGGRLRAAAVPHRHVVEHDDGSVSAIVIREVPAFVCEVCEESYYEPAVTDAVVQLLKLTHVPPGRAVAIDYPTLDAA